MKKEQCKTLQFKELLWVIAYGCLNVNFRKLCLSCIVKFEFFQMYIVKYSSMKFYQYYSMFLFFFMIARSVKVVYKEIRRKLPIYMQERARTKLVLVPFILHKTRTTVYISVQTVYINHVDGYLLV